MNRIHQLQVRLQEEVHGLARVPLLAELGLLLHATNSGQTRLYADEILQIAYEAHNVPAEAEAYKLHAIADWSQGVYQDALYHGRRAVTLFREVGDDTKLASAINMLGVIYLGLGDYQLAIDTFLQSLPFLQKVNHEVGLAYLHNNIGICYLSRGEIDKAFDYLRTADLYSRNLDNPILRMEVLANLGKAYMHKRQMKEAFNHLNRALETSDEQEPNRVMAVIHDHLAEAYLYKEQPQLALTHQQQASTIRQQIGHFNGVIDSSLSLGRIYLSLGKPEKAIETFFYVVETAQTNDSLSGQMRAHEELANVFEAIDQHKQAFHHLQQHLRLSRELYAIAESQEMRELRVKYEADRKEANAEIYRLKNVALAEKNEQLATLNKEVSELMDIMAHDLRNPLASMKMIIEMLLEESDTFQTNKQIPYLRRLLKAADQMTTITTTLLHASKVESGTIQVMMERVPLHDLLQQCVMQFETQAQHKGIVLQSAFFEDDIFVQTDAHLLKQVMDNICSNALKYSFPDSTVTIRTSQKETHAFVEVQDQGQGMTEEDIKKVFTKFARLSAKPTNKEASVGLGLFIAQKLMTMLGGEVRVGSDGQGLGSTFTLVVPLATENLSP